MSRRRADRGSSAVWVVVMVPALLALLGLVLDGGRAIFDRQQAGDVALQAARVAVSQCDRDILYLAGTCEVIDTAQACAQARQFVGQQEPTGKSVQSGLRLTMTGCRPVLTAAGRGFAVTVDARAPTTVVGMLGIDEINVQSTQTAISVTQDG